MATQPATEVYDLLILVDATYSMFNYLEALKISLPKVIAISNLTDSFSRIGLLAYRDYSEASRDKDGMLEWSGWYDHGNPQTTGNVTAEVLMRTAANLEPIGGGDYPEATKTGLARAYSLMRADATTIILLYTDAPPHCYMVADHDRGSNFHAEQSALKGPGSYDGFGPHFADWVTACKQLHAGPKKAQVLCFLDASLEGSPSVSGYYTYLSTITRGACFTLTHTKPLHIAQLTVDVLLTWMGTEKKDAKTTTTMPAKLMRYQKGDNIKTIKDERDPVANDYFWAHSTKKSSMRLLKTADEAKVKQKLAANLAQVDVDSTILKKYLPKRKTALGDFGQRYVRDDGYKEVVVRQLRSIIEMDVSSMSLNPVFGTLWRTVCNDRSNPARDELITAFGLHVDRIANADEKARMKNWLEESYDYAAEILEVLDHVPISKQFPCVFLDPTINFQDNERDQSDDEGQPLSTKALSRDALLEIGRSCDGRVLRRLGAVLTRLTVAMSEADLPEHIKATSNSEVPKIPLALASKEHEWKFWKILLHVVLPGTMLAARPATVLAALTIRIGLKPLFETACEAMMAWRDKWNNIEIPETWNASCLSLLLDADSEYRKQLAGTGSGLTEQENALLLAADRRLFSRLVTYQHTGKNLLTTLTVKTGWTPNKTKMPLGSFVICRGCKFPRSVTIMAERSGGYCGLCIACEGSAVDVKQKVLNSHATQDDNEKTHATWVECSIRTCRAQYVCYNVEDLNVRPKCHFCRLQTGMPTEKRNVDPAPCLECTRCLSKIIWPSEFRATVTRPFVCTACHDDRTTVVEIETNADQICKENGRQWLLRNDDNVIQEPFVRSLYHTVSSVGAESFMSKVEVFPEAASGTTLRHRGKIIRNQAEMIATLKSWVARRGVEKAQCSLCFESFPKSRILPACRRRGCHQSICESCLKNWYGSNRAGMIINMATLFCPFCRRVPAPRTLASYGKGIHAVTDLAVAMNERETWIHAWCHDCGKARRFVERVCARGAPAAVERWLCEICARSDLERARVAYEEAQHEYTLLNRTGGRPRRSAQRRMEDAARLVQQLENPPRNCPGCKTPTEKICGCDHMACSIPGCDTHWCWTCGGKYSLSEIYDHMDRCHRALYAANFAPGTGYDSDEGEDEEDDDS